MATDIDQPPHVELSELGALLTADALSALMRSTWTWDDRALRRDLAALLATFESATRVSTLGPKQQPIAAALRARAHAAGSAFVANVLGPRLIADSGNPFRAHYLNLATEPARFSRDVAITEAEVAASANDYLSAHVDTVDYVPPAAWSELVADNATEGLNTALRAYGHSLADSAFFASKALAWQAVTSVPRCVTANEYARRLAADDIVGTLAAAEETGSWDPALVRTRATKSDNGWVLDGAKYYVPAAADADVIFAIGRSTAGPSLFAVDRGARGLEIKAQAVTDPTRRLYSVSFADTPATLVGIEGAGGKLMSQLIDRATTALAAEQVGVIEAAINIARSERLVDDPLTITAVLEHAAAHAMWQRAVTDSNSESAAAAAHVVCSTAAVRVTVAVAAALESDTTHALVQRAMSGSLLFGGPALSYERLLDRLGI